jgi:oxygen-independent coproporphyrinogen-3 oxidase
MDSYIEKYVDALCQEVRTCAEASANPLSVHTIFLGGGTPTVLETKQLDHVLSTIDANFQLKNDAEITLEANPETVSEQSLVALRKAGFNRISFGMQSASRRDLQELDRQHTNNSVRNAVGWSKTAGFEYINLDLIYGIPGQTLKSWRKTLEFALALKVDHYSAYGLTVEDGTLLKSKIDAGLTKFPDQDLAGAMYEECMQIMHDNHFQQYEISNWAVKESSRCRHNLQYWQFLPYLGFGAGAHGFYWNLRTENVKPIPEYIQKINSNLEARFPAGKACENVIQLTPWEALEENVMVSLRLTQDGISLNKLESRHGVRIDMVFEKQINKLLKNGLLEWHNGGEGLRLTHKGKLLGNRVFSEFVGNEKPVDY